MKATLPERHLVGILIGGKARRMAGAPKGLLRRSDGGPSLVEGLLEVARESLGSSASCVLVGASDAYEHLGLPMLRDAPPGIGPMGGLASLLAEGRRQDLPQVLALACDLPFVTATLLAKVANAPAAWKAAAPKQGPIWQPLFARYSVHGCESPVASAIASGQHSLQRLFEHLGDSAGEVVLAPDEQRLLLDWDSPSDIVQD